MESPVPGDGYAGFGERPGETGQEQSGYRAPGRLNRAALPVSGNDARWSGQGIAARELLCLGGG